MTQSDAASACADRQATLMTCSSQEITDAVRALVEDPSTGENILHVCASMRVCAIKMCM